MGSRLPDIFLSYNRDDQATALQFSDVFEREGFSLWWDATLNSSEAHNEATQAHGESVGLDRRWERQGVAVLHHAPGHDPDLTFWYDPVISNIRSH
jgi:hypothetical protein